MSFLRFRENLFCRSISQKCGRKRLDIDKPFFYSNCDSHRSEMMACYDCGVSKQTTICKHSEHEFKGEFTCTKRHKLIYFEGDKIPHPSYRGGAGCNVCNKGMDTGYHCPICSYDICVDCSKEYLCSKCDSKHPMCDENGQKLSFIGTGEI
jgi:hypothetical protein